MSILELVIPGGRRRRGWGVGENGRIKVHYSFLTDQARSVCLYSLTTMYIKLSSNGSKQLHVLFLLIYF